MSVSNIHGHGVPAHGPRTVSTQPKKKSEKPGASGARPAGGGSSFEQELASVDSTGSRGDGSSGGRYQGNPDTDAQAAKRKVDLSA